LFLDPGFNPDVLHALAISQKSWISLNQALDALARILVAENAHLDTLGAGALPDFAEGRSTLTAAATASRLRFRQVTQIRPELLKTGDLFAPILIALQAHGVLKTLGPLRDPTTLGTKPAI
jgi:hypothetical protein